MMQSELSLKSFSTAVEAIYDCALDAAHWKEALRLIGALMVSIRPLGMGRYGNRYRDASRPDRRRPFPRI